MSCTAQMLHYADPRLLLWAVLLHGSFLPLNPSWLFTSFMTSLSVPSIILQATTSSKLIVHIWRKSLYKGLKRHFMCAIDCNTHKTCFHGVLVAIFHCGIKEAMRIHWAAYFPYLCTLHCQSKLASHRFWTRKLSSNPHPLRVLSMQS